MKASRPGKSLKLSLSGYVYVSADGIQGDVGMGCVCFNLLTTSCFLFSKLEKHRSGFLKIYQQRRLFIYNMNGNY